MMISRYMIPKKIKGYRSGTVNALIDCVQALWPIQSATLLTTVTAAGTKQEVKRFPKPPKEPDVVSWRTERTGTLQITVTAGFVEFLPATYLYGDSISGMPGESGRYFLPLVINIPTGNSEWWVWMEPNVTDKTATILNAAVMDELTPAEIADGVVQRPISRILIDNDSIVYVQCYQYGDIYLKT